MLDAAVAIQAVQAKPADVVAMAERDGLRERVKVRASVIIGAGKPYDPHKAAAYQRRAADDKQPQPSVCGSGKNLGHAARPVTAPKALNRQLGGRFRLPGTKIELQGSSIGAIPDDGGARMTGLSGSTVEYEATDAEPRLVAWLAVGIAAFLILSPLVLQFLFPNSLHRAVEMGELADVPAPRLQISPQRVLSELRQAEDERLSSYGWVSRDRKTVHIPIDRAVGLTLEHGLRGWPKQ